MKRSTLPALFLGGFLAVAVAAALAFTGVVDLSPTRTTTTPVAPQTSGVAARTAPSGSLAALYRRVSSGVVYVPAAPGQGKASGSGVLPDSDGHIVTNEHV